VKILKLDYKAGKEPRGVYLITQNTAQTKSKFL